jgi:hypothetical protein
VGRNKNVGEENFPFPFSSSFHFFIFDRAINFSSFSSRVFTIPSFLDSFQLVISSYPLILFLHFAFDKPSELPEAKENIFHLFPSLLRTQKENDEK